MRNGLMNRHEGSVSGITSSNSFCVIVKKTGFESVHVKLDLMDTTVTVKVLVSNAAGFLYQKDRSNTRISDDSRFHWEIQGKEQEAKATRHIGVLINYHFCVEREQAVALNRVEDV